LQAILNHGTVAGALSLENQQIAARGKGERTWRCQAHAWFPERRGAPLAKCGRGSNVTLSTARQIDTLLPNEVAGKMRHTP